MSRVSPGSPGNFPGSSASLPSDINLIQVGSTSFSLGQQLAAASLPIVLTAAQLTTLTPPAAITNYALETGGNLATLAGIVTSSRAAVNPISGQSGVQGGSGLVSATTQRVVLATDVALPTGSNVIGAVTQSGTWNIATLTSITNTVTISGTVTANAGTNLNTSLLALESGGNLATIAAVVRAEDAASADADKGIGALAIRKASPANTSGTDGDYEYLQMSAGRLWASATIDTALPAGTNVIGHVIVDSGTITTVSTLSNISQIASTTPTFGDVNNSATETGTLDVAPIGRYNATQPTLTDTRYNQFQVSSRGELLVGVGTTGFATTTTLQTQTDTVMIGGVNIKEINAVTPLMGNGTTGTGSLRVTIASDNTAFAVNATLSAETTKVIGVVRTSDGAGNLLTSNSTTYTAKFALDGNLLGTLGTAFSTAGKVDVKGADGDVFVRQTTASNLNATVVGTGTFAVQATVAAGATNIAKAEDVASADADVGVPAMAIRKATPANTSGTDGDYEMLQVSAGRLWVSTVIDTALPAGTALIGKVGIDQTTVGTTNGVSLAQIGSATVSTGNGVVGTGVQRVAIASDNTAFSVNATLSAETTKVIGVVRNADGSGNLLTSTSNALDVNLKTSSITVNTAEVAPTTLYNGKKTVTTAGTRVTLAASTTVKSVTIKALVANTGTIYVGDTSVASTNGFALSPGDSVSMDLANLNTVNLDSSVSGEGVTYIGVN